MKAVPIPTSCFNLLSNYLYQIFRLNNKVSKTSGVAVINFEALLFG